MKKDTAADIFKRLNMVKDAVALAERGTALALIIRDPDKATVALANVVVDVCVIRTMADKLIADLQSALTSIEEED